MPRVRERKSPLFFVFFHLFLFGFVVPIAGFCFAYKVEAKRRLKIIYGRYLSVRLKVLFRCSLAHSHMSNEQARARTYAENAATAACTYFVICIFAKRAIRATFVVRYEFDVQVGVY